MLKVCGSLCFDHKPTATAKHTAASCFNGKKKKNILMHDRTHHRVSCGVGFVEERVQVRQKCVTDPQVMFGGRHQQ